MLLRVLLSINTYIGAAFAFALVMTWAVIWYGPTQYRAGETETVNRLTKEYDDAIDDLEDEADKAVARQLRCITNGGVWLAGRGECITR